MKNIEEHWKKFVKLRKYLNFKSFFRAYIIVTSIQYEVKYENEVKSWSTKDFLAFAFLIWSFSSVRTVAVV